MKNKIQSLPYISSILKKARINKKIILSHGVFDLLHAGHIKHLEKAKSLGDVLIVSITSDNHVNKGPGRPIFNERIRAESLAAIGVVDYVVINNNKTAINPIKMIKPDIYCKGAEYKNFEKDITGEIKNETKFVKKFKGKVVFTNELTFSSSNLINRSSNLYSTNHKNKIKKIKTISNFKKIRNIIEGFKDKKVLIIGETIIDQYNFCDVIGKSSKEPTMVMSEKNSENHLGGVLGILRHVSELCNNVSTISMLGEKKEFLNYIKKKLPKKIKTNFIFKKNSPTIVKKRYMDQDSNYKIFGIYNINDENLTPENEKIFHKILKRDLKKYDLVIVSDYGHGFISKKSASLICKHSKFLAINTQLNAYNYSYHTIKNYKNFNTLIINEKELRNETRDKSSKIENLMMNLSKDRNLKNLVVTRGSNGSILYSRKKKQFYYADAYATNIVDKVGAGDTMLGVIAFCIESKTDYNISLLISSLAAAQSVENLGNRYSINKLNMLRALETILK